MYQDVSRCIKMSRWHKLTIWNELQLLSDASRRLAFLAKGSAQVLHGVPRPRPNECLNSLNSLNSLNFLWILWILSYFHVFSRSFTYFHVFSRIFPMQKLLQKPLQIWIRLDQSMAWKLVAQVSQDARIARVALSLPSPAWPGSLQLWPHPKLVFHLISSYDPITILSQLSDTCWDSRRLKGQECKAM